MTQTDFHAQFPNMTPIKRMPSLVRFNGCGTTIMGKRDVHAPSGAYVTTFCITLLYVPIFFLRAYRVAHADRGWYFLGREPLSILAKTFNFAIILALVSIVGGIGWDAYSSTAAYKAHRKMADARALVEQGHLAQAAGIYQELASAGADEADNATHALKDLADPATAKTSPLAEYAGVLDADAKVTTRNGALMRPEIVAFGMQLVTDKGDADPRGALAVLDAIRPLAIDTRPIDKSRLPLLRKWAADQPANLDAVVPLASLLEQQNQLDEARKLLLPVKDKLGDGEGARVLGTILVRDGDYDGAHALLWPYVKVRLDRLHSAEKNYETTVKSLWDRELNLLRDDKGPRDFYEKYKLARKEDQDGVIRDYVAPRIKGDPALAATQETLTRESAVVPVTLELGIVMLHRAQAQADPAARKKQLEAAEQVFLAITGVAGESDEYRLYLGQVYYWLGKQPEGRKLFDELLASKGRSAESLISIAERLYDLGAEPDSRTLAEEAYAKATEPDFKHQAAGIRALVNKDLDDEIVWLNKCDTADPTVKARLACVLGRKAHSEDRDEEAVREYRVAIDAYNAMPRNSTTLNDTAIAYGSLFQATGDHQALEHCVELMHQAVTLSPSNATLIFNAAATTTEATIADVIGHDLDLHALREVGNFSLLGYLYKDQAGRDALAQRVKDHPGTARSLAYLEKAMVLSPKHVRSYFMAYQYHHFTYNDEALRTLEQRLKSADIDYADQFSETREFVTGAKDAKFSANTASALKRMETLCNSLRPRGDRTAAVAIAQYALLLMSQDTYTNAADPAKILALAQEAQRLSPSSNTDSALQSADFFRATKDLTRTEPAFADLHKKYGRSLGLNYVIVAAINEPGPLQQKVLQNPDIKQAIALELAETRLYPTNPSSFTWAILRVPDPAVAGATAETIRKSPRRLVDQSISLLIAPASGGESLESSWIFLINGKPAEARQVIEKTSASGIPIPALP